MRANFVSETEMPGIMVSEEQLQMICFRYYFASRFVQGKQVLEVGCGPGLGLGYLARRARRVIGGDCTEASLRRAQEHYQGKVGLLSLDAHSLPFKDSCFNVVLLFEAIYYLSQPSKFLDECHRVLKNKGILVCCLPNKDVPGFRESPLSNRYYSIPELFTLLGQHHFDAKFFGAFPTPIGLNRMAWQRFLQAMANMVAKALDLVPRGKRVKEFLRKFIFHPTVLNNEIDDEMVENIQLEPLHCGSPDFRHRILYVIANARSLK